MKMAPGSTEAAIDVEAIVPDGIVLGADVWVEGIFGKPLNTNRYTKL